MTTPPFHRPNTSIQKSNFGSNPIKNPPNPNAPVAGRDLNYGFSTNDLDWAQLFSSLDNEAIAALHTRSDIDSGPHAAHHSLGTARNQASQGDHIHDGQTSKLIGNGMGLSVTGAKGGNVALTNLLAMLKQVIQFSDTTT